MAPRYVFAPDATRDLAGVVRLTKLPSLGHLRIDITKAPVRFYLVYSYFIIYRPETNPLEIVSSLHSRRDVGIILDKRLK